MGAAALDGGRIRILAADLRVDLPGWQSELLATPDLSQGLHWEIIPEPIRHVYADSDQRLVRAWPPSVASPSPSQLFIVQTDEDMLVKRLPLHPNHQHAVRPCRPCRRPLVKWSRVVTSRLYDGAAGGICGWRGPVC